MTSPQLTVVLNGGVRSDAEIALHLGHVDGVMVGREAYHHPWVMSSWDERFFDAAPAGFDRAAVEAAMVRYMEGGGRARRTLVARSRHMIGLRNGEPGARLWRQVWSDHRLKDFAPRAVAAAADAAARSARLLQPTAARDGQVASTMPASASAKAPA